MSSIGVRQKEKVIVIHAANLFQEEGVPSQELPVTTLAFGVLEDSGMPIVCGVVSKLLAKGNSHGPDMMIYPHSFS
jgi:hypothetical protein